MRVEIVVRRTDRGLLHRDFRPPGSYPVFLPSLLRGVSRRRPQFLGDGVTEDPH